MRNFYKVTAIVGVLGLCATLAVFFLDGEETASEKSLISTQKNKQQSLEAIESSSDSSEQVVSSEADIPVEESEDETIVMDFESQTDDILNSDDEVLSENDLSAESDKLAEKDVLPESDPLAEVEPFLAHEAGLKYDEFFAQLDSDDSLTEEQIQDFFNRMSATIETSDEAREAVARAYRNTEGEDVMERGVLAEMLMKTEIGRSILLDEAKSILANGQEDRFADMFQTYQNTEKNLNTQVLDQALISAATSTDLRTATSALNYIGRLENAKDFSPIYLNQATSTLEHIAAYNENDDVRSLATQKLYRLLGPEQSSTVAQYHIENSVSTPLVMETLYSIGSGDITLNPDLQNALSAALNRNDVTPEEIELAKNVLPST